MARIGTTVSVAMFRIMSVCRQFKFQCGYGAYVRLMNQYPRVTDVFLSLDEKYQQVWQNYCSSDKLMHKCNIAQRASSVQCKH